MPRPLRVFLCHASQDKPAVRRLHRYLKQHGVQPWLDELDLLPGENWERKIPSVLSSSDVILVCLSKSSVDKEGYVQKEISVALDKALEKPEGRIFIIPVKLEECEIPNRLRSYHGGDIYHPNGRKHLLLSLNERVKELGSKVNPVTLEETRQIPIYLTATVIVVLLLLVGLVFVYNNLLTFNSGTIMPSETLMETIHPISEIPSTATFTPVPPTPTLGSDLIMISEKDGMVLVYVPAGEFKMGGENYQDELPRHQVQLDAFWIDKTEVSNAMYARCVADSACKEPVYKNSLTHSSYFDNSEFDNYPVVYVDWNMANTYCLWANRRLPTEAEWEKAARGPGANIYPWGNTFDGTRVNYCDTNCSYDWADKTFNDGYADVAPVGSYLSGKSVYGALDMAGNVWEWVNDWYSETYYQISPSLNPLGPESGQYRVLRGGSLDNYVEFSVRSSDRISYPPSYTYFNVGFRCSLSLP